MRKKYLMGALLVIVMSISACASEINGTETQSETVWAEASDSERIADTNEGKQYITAERFKEYYQMYDTTIPDAYIQGFILQYSMTEKSLEDTPNGKALIEKCYERGDVFGHDLGALLNGNESDKSLIEFIHDTEIVAIEFDMRFGEELSHAEQMVIDFKEGKIYYNQTQGGLDYTQSDFRADLTSEQMDGVKEELLAHIDENAENASYGSSSEYTYIIRFVDAFKNKKTYRGDAGDEVHFPGFDAYWKQLFQNTFGEEYKFVLQ